MKHKKISLFFWGMLGGLFCLFLWIQFHPDRTFSENENRVLTEKPQFSLQGFLDTTYQEDLESSLQDQMPGRNLCMELATQIKKWTGRREIGDAYLGENGRYFEAITEEDIAATKWEKKLQRMNELAERHPQLRCSALLVPESGIVMPEELPKNAPMYDALFYEKKVEESLPQFTIVPLVEAMKQAPDVAEYYYKTDHHWTMEGAVFAWQMWREATNSGGTEPAPAWEMQTVTDSFYGSLYSRTLDRAAEPDTMQIIKNLPQTEVVADGKSIDLYEMEALDQKDKYRIFFGGNHGLTEITGGRGEGTILILKDSFANCFAPLLLGDYERILLIDLRYFRENVDNIIEEYDVTDLLLLYELHNLS